MTIKLNGLFGDIYQTTKTNKNLINKVENPFKIKKRDEKDKNDGSRKEKNRYQQKMEKKNKSLIVPKDGTIIGYNNKGLLETRQSFHHFDTRI